MAQHIVLTKHLTKKFGKQTSVSGLEMRIEKGQIYGFLGPNGAGKTTTIRMLLGLIRPTEGEIQLFGRDIRNNRLQILRRIGSLVESPSYYGNLTGRENLEVIRKVRALPESRIAEALEIVRLTKAADRLAKEYSLGMKQRLGIASALMSRPDLLVLDEPTNGLDPAGIHEIRKLIKELPDRYGMTVLVSSHLLSEIDQMATQVGIILNGKLIFQDDIEALRKKQKPFLKIEAHHIQEAQSVLQSRGLDAKLLEGNLWMAETAPEFVSEINRMLVKSGISVYRLEEVKRSLEDIFLELTGAEGSL